MLRGSVQSDPERTHKLKENDIESIVLFKYMFVHKILLSSLRPLLQGSWGSLKRPLGASGVPFCVTLFALL